MKAQILRGRSGVFTCCILLAANPSDELEIVHSTLLKAEQYRKNPPVVYGVAATREEAFDLVARLYERAARAGMPGEVRRYLESLHD